MMTPVIKPIRFTKRYVTSRRSTGVALVTAILITSLVSIAAVSMVSQQYLDVRRTRNLMHFDQVYVYAIGAEDWAKNFLLHEDKDTNVDHYPNQECQADPAKCDVIGMPIDVPISIGGAEVGRISGVLTDASAAFPMNSMVDNEGKPQTSWVGVFELLITETLEMNGEFHNAVLDWIDKGNNVSLPGGHEDLDYLNLQDYPYLAANRPMASVSELRLLLALSEDRENADNDFVTLARPEFNPLLNLSIEAIEQQPLVNALPPGTKININTAPGDVLRALVNYVDDEFTDDVVNTVLEERLKKSYRNIDDFNKLIQDEIAAKYRGTATGRTDPATVSVEKRFESMKNMVSVNSEYFYLYSRAEIADTEVWMTSVLHRKDGKVTTVRRGVGVI